MLLNFKRVLKTSFLDLVRHKSITLSSIAVMSLVFLVFSVFSVFAYTATKLFEYIETREHLEVFFTPETSEDQILEIKANLENTGKTAVIEYTNQQQAAEFLRERHSDNPLILGAIDPEELPASLAIRAKKIDYIEELNSIILDQDQASELIYKIGYNAATTNLLKDLLFWVRLVGGVLFVILVVVIFMVSLITVEISMTLRSEELSIMQLVGGGKWYIRAPFIIQGAIYGIVGAIITSIILTIAGGVFYYVQDQSPTLSFIARFFSDLELPSLNFKLVGTVFIIEIILGGFVGTINSLLAVARRLR